MVPQSTGAWLTRRTDCTHPSSDVPVVSPSLTDALQDRYRLERELGRGGMATVYLARDLKHGRDVALKVLRPELAVALGTERFLQEIRISSRLDHPHILTLIDSGESQGFVWYVLPYVRGESLRDKLNREKQLSVEEAVRIATHVASALEYAHRHGIIHRDVKPENILLHEGEAVVTDFGIALAVQEAGGSRITETGLSLGTPQYMSPEQATGDRELDARSDIYSLGAVVYETLSGEPPHTGPTVQAVIAKLLHERPRRLAIARNRVPECIDTAVSRALEKVPADRFASATDFALALAVTSGGQAPDPRRRRVVALAAIVAGLALTIIAAVAHPWRSTAEAPVPGADVASVAVLPFDNLTGVPGDQYLSDGMTEEVIGQVAQVRGLKVISRTSSEALKGTRLTLRQIADTLGVRHIVEGSVRHAENRIRVTVDLIDATTDAHVWASRYDRDLTDVFAVQTEIAKNVADSLVSTVGMRPSVASVSRTEQPGAYAAYLAARTLVYRRTREGMRGALAQFQQAIADDSTYAPAYAGLASVHYLTVSYQYRDIDPYEGYGQALAMANRAITLDSNLAEAYASRGLVLTRSWAPAERVAGDFKRALELRPNSADVHQWYSHFLSREGREDEAFVEAERAVSLDPLAPGVRVTLVISALGLRRHTLAMEEAGRVLALEPGLVRSRQLQALGALLSSNLERCTPDGLGPYVGVRAMCLYSLGRTREATTIIDSLRTAIATGTAGDSSFSASLAFQGLAQYYAWTGDAEQSITWLERGYAIAPDAEDFRIMGSGLYDKVRNDPRFRARLERARTQIYDRVRRVSVGS
jgi:TolB-like protein/tetratricopeptide (TPR) repeat protein